MSKRKNRYPAGTKVDLLTDGAYSWGGCEANYTDVYGIIVSEADRPWGQAVRLFKRAGDTPLTLNDDEESTWFFYDEEMRRAKEPKS
jgi:hypothetical protein